MNGTVNVQGSFLLALGRILVLLREGIGKGRYDKFTLYDIVDRVEILPMCLIDCDRHKEFMEHVEDLARRLPEFGPAWNELRIAMLEPTPV